MTTDKPPLSIERVRDLYSFATAWRAEDAEGQRDMSALRESNRAEFDAALAEHDRAVAEQAWGEAFDAAQAVVSGLLPYGYGQRPDGSEIPEQMVEVEALHGAWEALSPLNRPPFRSVPKENE